MGELAVAKNNEKWMKKQGAIEFGEGHYRLIVFIHSMFFAVFLLEVLIFQKSLSPAWPIWIVLFLLTQVGRIWALFSLGRYWNTKILVVPNAKVMKKGPYRFMKHPNYVIVAIELIVIPMVFQAYLTAILFTFFNFLILSIRIPAEEKALMELTEYESVFLQNGRFFPINFKKM
jgi:methyltransferase